MRIHWVVCLEVNAIKIMEVNSLPLKLQNLNCKDVLYKSRDEKIEGSPKLFSLLT